MTYRLSVLGPLALAFGQLLATPAAEAAPRIAFSGVELVAGINQSSDWDNGTSFGASVDLGNISRRLTLHSGLYLAKASDDMGFFGETIELDLDHLAIGAEVRYWFRQEGGWYLGGGPYVHKIEYEQVLSGTSIAASFDTTSVGAMGVAGYSWGRFIVEARVNAVSRFNGVWFLAGIGFGGDR